MHGPDIITELARIRQRRRNANRRPPRRCECL